MRRARVWKTLALVLMVLSLATGLCAAKDKDEMTFMWEEEGPGYGEKYKYYIDDKETKIIDIGGRKYLQMYWQRNKLFMEQFWMVMTWREAEKAHFLEIFDIGNQKAFYLEFLNKDNNPKKGKFDISTIAQNSFPYGLYEQKVIQWMAANRKSILEEINKANGDAPDAGLSRSTAPTVVQNGKPLQKGKVIVPPTTLPTDKSGEIYNLSEWSIPYDSEGWNHESGRYILSLEDPRNSIGTGGMVQSRPRGEYLMRNEVQVVAGIDDFSFDYDEDLQAFTIYDGEGAERIIRYDAAENALIVKDFRDSAYSGTYVYDASVPGYIMYVGNHKIQPHVAALVTQPFEGEGRYDVDYRNGLVFEVVRNPKNARNLDLPDKWYKMTNVNNKDDWAAFTYDAGNNLFTMYNSDADGNPEKYAYRQFVDDNRIATWQVEGAWEPGASDGEYVRTSWSGCFENNQGWSSETIVKYITDGMFIFLHYVKK